MIEKKKKSVDRENRGKWKKGGKWQTGKATFAFVTTTFGQSPQARTNNKEVE